MGPSLKAPSRTYYKRQFGLMYELLLKAWDPSHIVQHLPDLFFYLDPRVLVVHSNPRTMHKPQPTRTPVLFE